MEEILKPVSYTHLDVYKRQELYSKKVYELSKTSENDELDGSLSYLNTKKQEFLAFMLKKRLYEFTPIEVSKMLGVTNKTNINRCAKLVNNGLLIPIIVKTRVRSCLLYTSGGCRFVVELPIQTNENII